MWWEMLGEGMKMLVQKALYIDEPFADSALRGRIMRIDDLMAPVWELLPEGMKKDVLSKYSKWTDILNWSHNQQLLTDNEISEVRRFLAEFEL